MRSPLGSVWGWKPAFRKSGSRLATVAAVSDCYGSIGLVNVQSSEARMTAQKSKLDVNICKIQLQNGNKCIIDGMFQLFRV